MNKNTKRTCALFLVLSLVMLLLPLSSISVFADSWQDSKADVFAGGDGTASQPYQISTAGELALLSYYSNNVSYMTAHYTLVEDIDLNAHEWLPISGFEGNFDGNGKMISGLNIGAEGNGRNYESGLFSSLGEDAVIKNVNLDVNIYTQSESDYSSFIGVGGLAGYNNGIIYKCNVTGEINSSKMVVGGLTGFNGGKIYYCTTDVKITNTFYTGGLVGMDYGGGIYFSNSNGETNGVDAYVGGLVGSAEDSVVDNCFSTSTITDGNNAAGLVSICYNSEIINSFATGDVSGKYAGGLCGEIDNSNVYNCYSTGNVTGEEDFSAVAGFSYSVTNVSRVENCYSTGSASANGNVGGFTVSASEGSIINNSYYNLDAEQIINGTVIEEKRGICSGDDVITGLSSDVMKGNNTEAFTITYKSGEDTYTADSFIDALNGGVSSLSGRQFNPWVSDNKNTNDGYPVLEITEAKSIIIKPDANKTNENMGLLQLEATVYPKNASDKTVHWSITNGGELATIDQNGLINAKGNGIIEVTASSYRDSNITSSISITITNQKTSWQLADNLPEGFEKGTGTAEDPIEISKPEELALLSKLVNEEQTDSGENYYNELSYKLTADIDIGAHRWVPIGNYDYHFKGNFDGNGKTIKGLNILIDEDNPFEVSGLFGVLENAVVESLKIKDASIKQYGYDSDSGFLAGETYMSTLKDCMVSGDIYAMDDCGGLVGFNRSNIDNCHTKVKITDIGFGRGSFRAGGLAIANLLLDDIDEQDMDMETNGITNSSSDCEIFTKNEEAYVAGLVAENFGFIKNSSSKCNITVKDYSYAGGLVTNNAGKISGCNAKGNISIANGSVSGGLIATNSDELKDSYAEVNITGDDYVVIGGLIGNTEDRYRYLTKSNSLFDVEKSDEGNFSNRTIELNRMKGPEFEFSIDNCYAVGDIKGKDSALLGGLVGSSLPNRIERDINSMAVADDDLSNPVSMGFKEDEPYIISNSHAKGTVTGGKNSFIGGITGMSVYTIENCFAESEVSGGLNSCIGGLAGGSAGVVSSSFFKGSVIGDGNEEDFMHPFAAGGLVGVNTGIIEKTYANCDVINGDNSFAGGLVGANEQENSIISDSYATGNVAGGKNSVVGGLVGENYQEDRKEYDSFAIGNSGGGGGSVTNRGLISNVYYNTDYKQTVNGKLQESTGIGYSPVYTIEGTEPNIIGLNTIQMTGMDSISEDCMNFTDDEWVETESINGKVYYPQLMAFNEEEISEDIKNSSLDSVTLESVPPVFTSDLSKSKDVEKGDNVTLKVKAKNEDGSLITYQWYKNGNAIEGETSNALTLNKVKESDKGSYSVTATNNILNIKIAETESGKCKLTVNEKNERRGVPIDSGSGIYNSNYLNSNTAALYSVQNGKEAILSLSEIVKDSRNNNNTNNGKYYSKENKKYFSDINEHWAKDSIDFVTARELFSGTESEVFSPDLCMTRGMLVTVLGRLWGVDINEDYQSTFADVNNDAYYGKYVSWAAQNSIVSGTGNNMFSPDQPIKREELTTIIDRFVSFTGLELTFVRNYSDFADNNSISDWATDGIIKLYKAGVINGKPGNVFEPQGMATRAEVASVIKSLFTNLIK